MPLSRAHKAGLERHLKAHNKDVAELRATLKSLARELERREAGRWSDPNPKPGHGTAVLSDQIQMIEWEIERHLALVELGRDERLLRTLDELIDHPDLIDKAAQDPKAFAKARGIKLPVTMEIELAQVDGHPQLRVVNYDRAASLTMVWDRNGFTLG